MAERRYTGLVDCYEQRPFWTSWTNGTVKIGTGTVDTREFMNYTAASPHDVNAVSIMTGWGATGIWSVPTEASRSWFHNI